MGKIGHDYDVIKVWLKQIGDFAAIQYDMKCWAEEKAPTVGSRLTHWVECNSLQKVLVKRVYKDLNLSLDVAWYPKHDDEKKNDKLDRIESLQQIAENGHIRFNELDRKNKNMQDLRDQFKGFPDGFIDGPDTVEGAISKLNKMGRVGNTKIRQGNQTKNYSRRG